jgi:hypothetical protein
VASSWLPAALHHDQRGRQSRFLASSLVIYLILPFYFFSFTPMDHSGHRAPSRDGGSYPNRARDHRGASPYARHADDRNADYRRPRKGTAPAR